MDIDLTTKLITSDKTVRELIQCIDNGLCKIAVLVDDHDNLIDTLTDGDVRRALIKGISLEEPVSEIQKVKTEINPNGPIVAREGITRSAQLEKMDKELIRYLPIVDDNNKVTGLVMKDELLSKRDVQLQAVIMAGGKGERLRPLTDTMPKPMLPMGDKPILELIVNQLKNSGILNINVTTHYKHEVIANHFGDGSSFGVNINYVEEDQPLGTAGSLKHLSHSPEPVLVINGDVLTDVNFEAMLDFHIEHSAEMTVAVSLQKISVPYGVIQTDGINITNIEEKPVMQHFMNAGFYLINPEVLEYIPDDIPFDMPDLILKIIESNQRVISFPVHEYWADIGKHRDYEQALQDLGKKVFEK